MIIMNKNKIIVILGQTSTGKSDLAVEIAKQVNGEILSADSRQVYKGLDLGTGKITKREMKGIPHYLLDLVSPKSVYTVNQFQKQAFKKISEISKKGKVPIICGGTGFYLDSILNETIFPNVPPNKKLREQLEKETTENLLSSLTKLDPIRAQNIDAKNRVRLIRAIEIAQALGQVPSLKTNQNQPDTLSAPAESVSGAEPSRFQVLKIGLTLPPEVLRARIKTRLLARIKKGMIGEIENLHKNGLSWKRMENLGLEYRYVAKYLQGQLNKKEMLEKLEIEIWHFAKRQKTWFKRDKNTIWIDPTKNSEKIRMIKEIKKFLLKKD